MTDGRVDVDQDGHTLHVTLNAPERMNAMTRSMQGELTKVFVSVADDPEVWLVHVTGAGDRAFSTGRDMKEMEADTRAGHRPGNPMVGAVKNCYEAAYECPVPVVASIQGWAVGGGLELALTADIRLASESARFAFPEVQRGLGANFGSNLLPRMVPLGRAMEMLMVGEEIDAEEALQWGLVNRVFSKHDFESEVANFLERLGRNAPVTTRRFKAVARKGIDLPFQAALRLNPSPDPYISEDRTEGVRAFNEKRAPRWANR